MFNRSERNRISNSSFFYNGVQQRLVAIRNELQAQKIASSLAYSSVLFPDNVPEEYWSGKITTDFSQAIMASFRATFTRNDEIDSTPLVDFTLDFDIPTVADWIKAQGGTVTGRDPEAEMENWVESFVENADDRSVSYRINFLNGIGAGASEIDARITVRAISPVPGTLKLERTL